MVTITSGFSCGTINLRRRPSGVGPSISILPDSRAGVSDSGCATTAPSLSLRLIRLPQREYGHELYDTLAFGPLTPSMMAPSRALSSFMPRTPHERERDYAGPER